MNQALEILLQMCNCTQVELVSNSKQEERVTPT